MRILLRMFLAMPLLVTAGFFAGETAPDRTIRVTAERFSFSPSRIRLRQGELVELVLRSEDTDHGLRIPAAGINAAIPPLGKGELRVRFLAREKGRYAFECSRPCGAGHNLMRGEIVVE